MKLVIKRFMDLILSITAVIVFMPLFILIAVAIKIDSKGPVIFQQDRIGKNGKVFTIYKFRTMICNAEKIGDGLFNYENDFRVTKVGRLLRKTSLDEAPQLINIFKGDMSIVGPRPPVTYEYGDYSKFPESWKKRFTLKPGVTGLAQVNGRNELSWEQKIKLDNQYIDLFQKYGVLIDIKIILITIVRVISMKSVYENPKNVGNGSEVRPEMIEEKRLIWLNGEIIPVCDANINILSPTAQYGLNVFEGIRCYWNQKLGQLYAFRLDDHYKRLKNSIKMLRIYDGYSISDLKNGLLNIVRANNYKEDITVRQTIFVDGYGNWSSSEPIGMFISPVPKGRIYAEREGINCCFSSWERISERNISPKIKVGANYLNSRMAQIEANINGFDNAIFLNNQGKVCESSGSCLFIIRDGVLITPPCTASVLESITRDTIIKIAKNELNIETIERDIDRTELYICNEAFLCGTSIEIVSIINVDGIKVGNEEEKIVPKLKKIYFKIVRGEDEKYKNWLTEIY